MVHIEKPDAGHTDHHSPKLFRIVDARPSDELLKRLSCSEEPVSMRRLGIAAKVRVVQLHNKVRASVIRVFKDDMNVVIGLALHPVDPSNDLIDAELLVADAVVATEAAMGR